MRLKRTSVDWHSPFKMYTMYMLTGMDILSEFLFVMEKAFLESVSRQFGDIPC